MGIDTGSKFPVYQVVGALISGSGGPDRKTPQTHAGRGLQPDFKNVCPYILLGSWMRGPDSLDPNRAQAHRPVRPLSGDKPYRRCSRARRLRRLPAASFQ